jgi:hypothetical protein
VALDLDQARSTVELTYLKDQQVSPITDARHNSTSHVSTMQRECLLQIALIKATKLPSTDLLSKIDAYVKVKVSTGSRSLGSPVLVVQYSADAAVQLCTRGTVLTAVPFLFVGQWVSGRSDPCSQ